MEYSNCCPALTISIHAPAKGATGKMGIYEAYLGEISIHAPAKGATLLTQSLECSLEISIHAPAKGATLFLLVFCAVCAVFQSTLPRRERRAYPLGRRARVHFNPRSREGSDWILRSFSGCLATNFNPRSREGSDILPTARARGTSYFNPRSREGSDAFLRMPSTGPPRFQSTLPRRKRLRPLPLDTAIRDISIHAPAKGATHQSTFAVSFARDFNPRSREGSDQPVAARS